MSKQKLKEEFDSTFCHQELSHLVPGGSHYVLNSGWTSLALWDWISIQLDELETKTRRESVEGFAEYVATMISPEVGQLFKKKVQEYLNNELGLYELERLSAQSNEEENK